MEYVRRIVAPVVALSLSGATATIGQVYDLPRATVDGGGIVHSAGGNFEPSGTIGQPDAGTLSGGAFAVHGGFWFPQVPADCNVDGGVDLYDYGVFEQCMSGPGGGLSGPSCVCFDLDADGDVDLQDTGAFQRSFSG